MVDAINQVLFLHNSVVSKFEVNFAHHGCSDVDRWILALSRKMLSHMTLRFGRSNGYQLPGCLFSCQSLRKLELAGCILRLPPLFQGLGLLHSLVLNHLNLSQKTFEGLLRELPLLSRLGVLYCESLTHVDVWAPNLLIMTFLGICHSINFLHTPKLYGISICMSLPGNRTTVMSDRILKSLPDICSINISQPIMEYTPSHAAPRRLNITYHKLKSVALDISFEDTRQLLAMLCLCRSSPDLDILCIKALWGGQSVHSEDFWEGQLHKEDDIFCHLKRVKLTAFKGERHEVGTVQFILLTAVVLKSIHIEWEKSIRIGKELLHLLEKINRFKRTSSEAEVIFSGL